MQGHFPDGTFAELQMGRKWDWKSRMNKVIHNLLVLRREILARQRPTKNNSVPTE